MSSAGSPRRGLGRGLDVLIGGLGAPAQELVKLPLDEIHPNPRQPRRRFAPEATDGLAGSIKAQGLLQPVVVRPRPEGGYELIAGVLLTMTDNRTRLSADVEAEVRKHFGSLVFDAVVPRSVRVAEAPSHGLPLTHYDRRSRGAEAYWKVAMELVERT